MVSPHPTPESAERIGLFGAVAMGVGGMIGAGIFSILGVVGSGAGSAAWLCFLLAGGLALFCGHSFAKLGVAFPSSGGPVKFLVEGLGNNTLSGTLNLMLWMGYVLALALYANAFAGYAAALLPNSDPDVVATWAKPGFAVTIVALFLVLNVLGAAVVGKAEGVIVAVKLLILLGFVSVTALYVKPELLSTAHWKPASHIAFAVGTTFLAFEGFGLITNAAGNMADPGKTLPRAIYFSIAIAIVVYVLVCLATFGNLPLAQISSKKEYALAAAAQPAFGQVGFTLMAVAALFSTASAINATLFGGANISFQNAHDRQMPEVFDHKVWHGSKAGLFITAGLVAVLAATLPLSAIANTGSAAFLLIYTGVAIAHLRLRDRTQAALWPIVAAIVGCLGVFVLLMINLVRTNPASAVGVGILILLSFMIETAYRSREA